MIITPTRKVNIADTTTVKTTAKATTPTKTTTIIADTTTVKTTTKTTTPTKKTTIADTTTVKTTTATTTKKKKAQAKNGINNNVFDFEKPEAEEGAESPYEGGYDKFSAFAECCWELRLLYYWECDLWLKKCCIESDNITHYSPVCSSTGPGYIRWWKPYRRIFYNECAATMYLCDSLPPLTLPWKCMWRRDFDHPHCKGSDKDGKHFGMCKMDTNIT